MLLRDLNFLSTRVDNKLPSVACGTKQLTDYHLLVREGGFGVAGLRFYNDTAMVFTSKLRLH